MTWRARYVGGGVQVILEDDKPWRIDVQMKELRERFDDALLEEPLPECTPVLTGSRRS